MKELSLHILDIAENSISAGASRIEISVMEHLKNDELIIEIKDNGKGMDARTVARITDPFVTSRTTRRVGLGIPFLKAAAESCNGSFKIESKPGQGTSVQVVFQYSHIDRMPMGDLIGTLLSLIIGYADIQWVFHYQRDEKTFEFDSKPIKEYLDDVPFSDPAVIHFIRKDLETGIENTKSKDF